MSVCVCQLLVHWSNRSLLSVVAMRLGVGFAPYGDREGVLHDLFATNKLAANNH